MAVLEKSEIFIDGEWVGVTSDTVTEILNPATEEVLGTVAEASVDDARRAIAAARRAFDEGPWPRMSPRDRARALLRLADALDARKDQFIELFVSEVGHPRMSAEGNQFALPVSQLRDMAERVVWGHEEITGIPPVNGFFGLGQGAVQKEAIGVASLISAYNNPLLLALWKIGPSLGAGCTVILKGSNFTPFVTLLLAEAAAEAEFPPGVLNIVTGGPEVGQEIASNPQVDMVSFTGSDTVGKLIMAQAAPTLKRVILELGGKSANLIFPDADLDRVVQDLVFQTTNQCGQACLAGTRTIVHASIQDDLVQRLSDALSQLKIGNPDDPMTAIGPLIREAQRNKVEGFIRKGVEEKGRIVYGGGRPDGLDRGFFFEPTIFVDVDNSSTIAQEEIFGPVQTFVTFTDSDEGIRLANDSRYGLAGNVWTADSNFGFSVAKQIRAGFVNLNGGSGGITNYGAYGGYKHSGLGREWGQTGFEEYLETKTINWSAGR